MPFSLPELPADQRRKLKDPAEREAEYKSLREDYYDAACSEFEAIVKECDTTKTLYDFEEDDWASALVDDDASKAVQDALQNLTLAFDYKLTIETRLKLLSAEKRKEHEDEIDSARSAHIQWREELLKLKKKMQFVKNAIAKQQQEVAFLAHENAKTTEAASSKSKEEKDEKPRPRPDLAPEVLEIDLHNPGKFKEWADRFTGYFKASRFKKEDESVQIIIFKKFVSHQLLTKMDLKIGKIYHVLEDQATEAGGSKEESLMGRLRQAWKFFHHVHQNRINLFKIRQEPSESYSELTKRIENMMNECDPDGLTKREHLEGYLILSALRDSRVFQKVLTDNKLKDNIVKGDIDDVALVQEGVEKLSGSVYDRLGPPVPSNSLNRLSSYGQRFAHLKGQEKLDAIIKASQDKNNPICKHCLKKHPGECFRVRDKARCRLCNKGPHTEEACCAPEDGSSLRFPNSSVRRGRGGQRKRKSESSGSSAPPEKKSSE